jgi:hypothetical protein
LQFVTHSKVHHVLRCNGKSGATGAARGGPAFPETAFCDSRKDRFGIKGVLIPFRP